LPNNQYYIDPQLGYFSDILDERKTLGASFGAAAKLSDAVKTRFNWFYSHEDDTSDTYSDKAWFNGSGAASPSLIPGIDPTKPYAIDNNGVVQNGTFNANGAETATLYQKNVTDANNFQWVTTYNNGGPLRGTLDVSYARATSNLQAAQADVEHGLYLTSAGVATSPTAPGCNNGASTCAGAGNHGYEFAYSNGGSSGLPTVSYLAPFSDVLNNPNYATFKSNWAWANLTKQVQYAIKGDLEYDPAFIKGVESTFTIGGRYADRTVDQTFGRYLINGTEADGQVAGDVGSGAGSGPWLYFQDPGYGTPNIPYSTAVSNPGLAKVVKNFAVGNILVKNPATMSNPSTYLEAVWAGAGVPNNTEKFFVDGLSSFRVDERTTAGYLMGDIGGRENNFHMNFGLRMVTTDLTIDNGQSAAVPTYFGTASWNGVDSNVVPVQTHRSYTDVLPSFNLTLDVSDTQIVRFGAARVVSPQDLFSLGLGNSYNFTRQTNSRVNVHTGVEDGFAFAGGSSGNAQLDPYRATQTFASYENYFARGALASVSVFYKAVDNFVETQNIATTVMDDFGGTSADVTEPVNAGKGKIYGVELGGQYAFGAGIAPWLKGFGVAANYTLSISSSDQSTSFSHSSEIPGVSKNSVTGTLYYERAGFSARASYSWRDTAVNDSVVGSTFAFADQNGVSKVYQVFSAPYGQLDAQIGYDITPRIGLVASVQNLTDEAQHTYLQWKNLPFSYDDSGRRYFLGIKFKL
jgi:iron complex outermembrane receptor protein